MRARDLAGERKAETDARRAVRDLRRVERLEDPAGHDVAEPRAVVDDVNPHEASLRFAPGADEDADLSVPGRDGDRVSHEVGDGTLDERGVNPERRRPILVLDADPDAAVHRRRPFRFDRGLDHLLDVTAGLALHRQPRAHA